MTLRQKKLSISIHDLRVSNPDDTIRIIDSLLENFPHPLSVHLIFDGMIHRGTPLYAYLKKRIDDKRIELVFHGLTHACLKKNHRLLSFYHKYQAEYLDDGDELRRNTGTAFGKIQSLFGIRAGICPPCWLAHKNNVRFFKSLKPLFVESLLTISYGDRKFFSPVISLGSPVLLELFFLRKLGRLVYLISVLIRGKGVRIAIHRCDIEIPSSMELFKSAAQGLLRNGYKPVLLHDLF